MKFDASAVPKTDMRISHRNWVNALSESFALLSVAEPGDVISITGPSRAGKSRLVSELKKLIVGDENDQQSGMMPVVIVEAVNTGPNGVFSTKSFIQRMLDAVQHPIFGLDDDDGIGSVRSMKVDRATEAGLRRALERAFKNRGTRFLFIDEAQHARYTSRNSQAPYAVMDSWKALAQNVGMVLVVVGAYPILSILQNSPHMLGRKQQVHLPRYTMEKGDLLEFVKIIRVYEKALAPVLAGNSLSEHVLFLHQGTCGCIGLLKKWLKVAATLATLYDKPLNRAMLEKTRHSDADLSEISREILDGEALLFASTAEGGAPAAFEANDSTGSSQKSSAGSSGRKPFRRNPKRHAVGNRTREGGGSHE